ncbi:MAG: GNAT family N-acetyltransferase [Saprospiraceae bacterium]|nr:GNAT family N-acetyltransferase [Saprospiraceae bacterium]
MAFQTDPGIPPDSVWIRNASPEDAGPVANIYNAYIAHSVATFELDPVSAEEMKSRIMQVQQGHPWLVAERNEEIIGYAYASAWKARAAYQHTVETTIYLDPAHLNRGTGYQLYQQLLQVLKHQGRHVAIGGIALPNPASIRLHERLGYQKVAHFKEVGYKFGQWVDVGYWELILTH